MAPSQSPPKRRYWRELFFFRRRPRLRGIPFEWERPATDEAYHKMLHDDGFISPTHWKGDNIVNYPIIAQDLNDLDEYLLPTFFELSQKSKYYQNQFYLYQWVFILGAFATTVLGALAALLYNPNPNVAEEFAAAQATLSYSTAGVGALTAFVTALSNRREPQKRWAKTRRLAEELRMHYFKYLAHLEPYDKPDRVQQLRSTIVDVRVKERENA